MKNLLQIAITVTVVISGLGCVSTHMKQYLGKDARYVAVDSGPPVNVFDMPDGRRRSSTGPKTPEGLERIRRAQLKHGRYTKAAKAERAEARRLRRELRAAIDVLDALGI